MHSLPFDAFVETWGVKYDKAVDRLIKDRDALPAFYDSPAEHWKHLQTPDEMDKRFLRREQIPVQTWPQVHSFVRPRRRPRPAPTIYRRRARTI